MQGIDTLNGSYYSSTAQDFQSNVQDRTQLLDVLQAGHSHYRPNDPLSDEQIRSWESSLIFLTKIIKQAELEDDQMIMLEAMIRHTKLAVDVIICGCDDSGKQHASLLELKTWHTQRRKGRKYDIRPYAEEAGCTDMLVSLHTRVDANTKEDIVSREKHPNTRLQVSEYARTIRHNLRASPNKEDVSIGSCIVLYNCTQLSQLVRDTLEYNIDDMRVKGIPIATRFGCDGSLSLEELAGKLKAKHGAGAGLPIYDKLKEHCLIRRNDRPN